MKILRLVSLLICIPALGQVSNAGRFSVDFSNGCAPLTIHITEHDGFGSIARQYFYENALEVKADLSHTYDTPGTYELVQLVGNDRDPVTNELIDKTDTLIIEVFDPVAPNFSYELCDHREIVVTIDDARYDSYEVIFADSFIATALSNESINYVFGSTEPLSIEVRGIYSNASDNCFPTTLVLPDIIDDLEPTQIHSAELLLLCEDQFGLNISSNMKQHMPYELYLNKSGKGYVLLESGHFESEILLELDQFSEDETSFCVRIDVNNVCDGTFLQGTELCQVIDSEEFSPIKNLYSTYEDESVLVALDEIELGEFVFERTFNGFTYSTIAQTSSSYKDAVVFSGRMYDYKVSYLDTCGSVWNQQKTSPPFIKIVDIQANRFEINFSLATHSLTNEFTYEAVLSGNGQSKTAVTDEFFSISLLPELGENQTLIVVGVGNGIFISSNPISLKFEFLVHVPKAFTPNNDGLNDRLEFFGLGDVEGKLSIYNRWGHQIYGEISSAPSWDGRTNGELMDEGVYVYEISIPEMANHVQRGTFALIKK